MAYLAAAVALIAECAVIAIVARRELGGLWEFARVVLGLLPVALGAAGPLAVGAAVVVVCLRRADRREARWALGAMAAGLALPVSWGVSTGRLLAGGLRPWFIAAVVVAAAAAGCWGARPVRRALVWLARRGRPWLWLAVASAVAGVVVVNAAVLPRLYPAFHAGLTVFGLWTAALVAMSDHDGPGAHDARARPAVARGGGSRAPGRRRRSAWPLPAAAALWLSSAVLAPWAAGQLGGYDNIRFIYLERSPSLSHAVELAARLSPPLPLDDALGYGPPRPVGPTVDLSGRDVLLITIDALRADHVGAYGYARPTTPHIDELAQTGVLFEAAYTPTPHTSYAVVSLMMGKHVRPLVRQGIAAGSQPWALWMRRYGYRTAGFYPPAVFYIDEELFTEFAQSGLGFEYRKQQFADPGLRHRQLESYLSRQPADQRLFVWVHLYEPHEPYEHHPEHDFGQRSIDRYDSEVAAADRGAGALVSLMRATRPRTVVLVAADHGEEFGDHGGRYHGTTVYDEQVRIPLIVNAPGLLAPRRIAEPVSLVDLLPTVLTGLGVPASPRLHGRDLGPLLLGEGQGSGFAFAETEEQTLLAQDSRRLICVRRVGACRLFDIAIDPRQLDDRSAAEPERSRAMKRRVAGFVASLGRYGADEQRDGRARVWPAALRRGMAGDGEAAIDVATLLDDADVVVRRKAAQVLFELRRKEAAPQLRRALGREEDETARRWCALALTRLAQGAPLTLDLLSGEQRDWRRLAALALAEAGDGRGEDVLLGWWGEAFPPDAETQQLGRGMSFARAKEVAAALAKIRSSAAVQPLARGLAHVRLRKSVAAALAAIGDDAARPPLAQALEQERYHDARVALASALVELGGSGELRRPLTRFLGVPDPMPNGLELAMRAGMTPFVGGPRKRELQLLRQYSKSGIVIGIVVPDGGNGTGMRALVRARSVDGQAGQVRFGLLSGPPPAGKDRRAAVPAQVPRLDPELTVTLPIGPAEEFGEVYATLPSSAAERIEPGEHSDFVLYATQNVEIASCAVVPLADELPPPPPQPWQAPAQDPSQGSGS